MKKKICLFVILLISSLLNAQNLQYRIIENSWIKNKDFYIKKNEIIEWNDKNMFFVNYDSNTSSSLAYELSFAANYQNEIIAIHGYDFNLELLNSVKIFDKTYFNFIPVYYLDVLKTKNRKIIFNKEPQWNYFKDEYATFEGESFYDTFYPEEIVLSNLFTYFTHNNYFIMKNISYQNGYYKIILYTPKIDAMGFYWKFNYQQPYPKTYMNHKDENEITLYLKFDGDYVDIWINSLQEYMGKYFVAPKESTQYEINQLVSTGDCNFNNIYWPRHADGTSDFDNKKIPPKVKLTSTEVTTAPYIPPAVEKPKTNVAEDKIMVTTENLKLRSAERTTSSILAVLQKGTKVKILELGEEETIDGIFSNWVCIELLDGAKTTDGKDLRTGIAGWVFGGYLKDLDLTKTNNKEKKKK